MRSVFLHSGNRTVRKSLVARSVLAAATPAAADRTIDLQP